MVFIIESEGNYISGGPSPDGALIKFKVISIQGSTVTIQIESNNAEYLVSGKQYEAAVRTKQP